MEPPLKRPRKLDKKEEKEKDVVRTIHDIPPELLTIIFQYTDPRLWFFVAQTCTRWYNVLKEHTKIYEIPFGPVTLLKGFPEIREDAITAISKELFGYIFEVIITSYKDANFLVDNEYTIYKWFIGRICSNQRSDLFDILLDSSLRNWQNHSYANLTNMMHIAMAALFDEKGFKARFFKIPQLTLDLQRATTLSTEYLLWCIHLASGNIPSDRFGQLCKKTSFDEKKRNKDGGFSWNKSNGMYVAERLVQHSRSITLFRIMHQYKLVDSNRYLWRMSIRYGKVEWLQFLSDEISSEGDHQQCARVLAEIEICIALITKAQQTGRDIPDVFIEKESIEWFFDRFPFVPSEQVKFFAVLFGGQAVYSDNRVAKTCIDIMDVIFNKGGLSSDQWKSVFTKVHKKLTYHRDQFVGSGKPVPCWFGCRPYFSSWTTDERCRPPIKETKICE